MWRKARICKKQDLQIEDTWCSKVSLLSKVTPKVLSVSVVRTLCQPHQQICEVEVCGYVDECSAKWPLICLGLRPAHSRRTTREASTSNVQDRQLTYTDQMK